MKKTINWIFLAFALLVSFSTDNYAQKVSANEQKIVNYIDAHTNEAIALIERTVNAESPTENLAGVKQVGMIFRSEFESLGFTTKWIEMPAEMKRAGHLLAEKKGTKGKRILLIGHLDTVLSGERFRREGDKAFGTGIGDMKAGIVVLFYALKALRETGALKDTSVIVMLTGDEEIPGKPTEISRAEMTAAARRSDFALSFEAGAKNKARTARRGNSNWELEVTARTGHSSGIFHEGMGSGAVFETARILNQFYETLRAEKYLTFNAAMIGGGAEVESKDFSITGSGKLNIIPARTLVRGELRFISEVQKEAARAKMREIVAKSLPGASAKITFGDDFPAMSPTEGNDALLKQLDQISQELNFGKVEAVDPIFGGAGDISFIANLLPCLDGLGAIGSGGHARGEGINLDTLPMQTKRAALLIYRLTR